MCQQVAELTLGLPSPSGNPGKVLSLLSNSAAGYGQDIATAPSELVLSSAAMAYVPGKSALDVVFSLLDSSGQVVGGTKDNPISHMVQFLILPVDADCATFEDCEVLKLQPTESFLSRGDARTTSTMRDFDVAHLKFCQVGVPNINIRLFVSTSPRLDAPPELASLQKIVTVNCLPCPEGWAHKEINDGKNGKTWTCNMCGRSQYIVDPNIHECQVVYHVCMLAGMYCQHAHTQTHKHT